MAQLRRRLSEGASSTSANVGNVDNAFAHVNDNDEHLVESNEEKLVREAASIDLFDVPAAVVCLVCGELDCTGCEDRELSRSGIVAMVAWERPGLPTLTRLWSTARSTTRDAETFFEVLPDGPVTPALRFAAFCELIATSSMVVAFLPVLAILAPDWLRHVALDPHARSVALRLLVLGIPAFAGLLVFAHAVHALSIDVGAKSHGARHARSRALRFGLYACGWDLVMGPLGLLVVGVKEGGAAVVEMLDLASVPGRSTRAFLRGCYGLEGERAKGALSTATTGVFVATLMGVLAVVGALIALALA